MCIPFQQGKARVIRGSRRVQRNYCKIKITDSKKDTIYSIKRYQISAFVMVMQMSLKLCSSTGKLKEEILSVWY